MKCPVSLCLLFTAYLPYIVEDGRALNCVAAHPLSVFKKKTKPKQFKFDLYRLWVYLFVDGDQGKFCESGLFCCAWRFPSTSVMWIALDVKEVEITLEDV